MERMIKTLMIGLITGWLVLAGCSSQEKQIDQYRDQVTDPESGLSVQQKIGDFIYTLRFIPPAQQMLATSNNAVMEADELKEALRQYEDHLYFSLNMKPAKPGKLTEAISALFGESQANQVLNQLYFQLQDNFKVRYLDQEIPCSLYHAVPPVFANSGLEILLVFSTPGIDPAHVNDDLHLVFNDDVLSSGELIFSFARENLNNIPQLKI